MRSAFCVLFVLAVPGLRQGRCQGAPDPAAAPKYLQYSGTLDLFGSQNLNHPASGVNQLRNFDGLTGVEWSAAQLTLQHSGDRFGFRVDAGYGEQLKTYSLPDPWHGPNRYLLQAYGSYKPVAGSGLQLDFGKFYTSIGAEVAETGGNFNYSRSLAFVLGAPYYHFGFRSSVPVSKSVTVGLQIVNGWNNVSDNNSGKSVGFTVAFTRPRYGLAQAYMAGPEKTGTNSGVRQASDTVLTLTPSTAVQAYGEFIYGREARIGGGRDLWYGVAGAVRWSPVRRLSFSPRMEIYEDRTGFTSGLAQRLSEVTGTCEYKANGAVTMRLEMRRDFSNRPFFDRGNESGVSRHQETLLLGVLLQYKGER